MRAVALALLAALAATAAGADERCRALPAVAFPDMTCGLPFTLSNFQVRPGLLPGLAPCCRWDCQGCSACAAADLVPVRRRAAGAPRMRGGGAGGAPAVHRGHCGDGHRLRLCARRRLRCAARSWTTPRLCRSPVPCSSRAAPHALPPHCPHHPRAGHSWNGFGCPTNGTAAIGIVMTELPAVRAAIEAHTLPGDAPAYPGPLPIQVGESVEHICGGGWLASEDVEAHSLQGLWAIRSLRQAGALQTSAGPHPCLCSGR